MMNVIIGALDQLGQDFHPADVVEKTLNRDWLGTPAILRKDGHPVTDCHSFLGESCQRSAES